jgi:acylphosphatase
VSSDAKRLVCLVSGTVQGVGFRYFVRQWGTRLGLHGTATNLADGRVEVVAEGAEAELEQLLAALRKGPPASRVDHTEVRWDTAQADLAAFSLPW